MKNEMRTLSGLDPEGAVAGDAIDNDEMGATSLGKEDPEFRFGHVVMGSHQLPIVSISLFRPPVGPSGVGSRLGWRLVVVQNLVISLVMPLGS